MFSTLAMRDIIFILTQNAKFVPRGVNKIRLSQLLLEAFQKKEITFQTAEDFKRPRIQQNQPVPTVAVLPVTLVDCSNNQFKQRQTTIPVAPSIETLLCSEFPSLYRLCSSHIFHKIQTMKNTRMISHGCQSLQSTSPLSFHLFLLLSRSRRMR